MSRTSLMGAASAAALALLSSNAFAAANPRTVTGGGSTLAEFDYMTEFATYNASSPTAEFLNTDPRGGTITYWASGSGTGQTSFFNNDNTCNSSRVITGTTTCANTPGGVNEVAYGASDSTLSSTQISSWQTIPYGVAVSGGLIQLPSMGIGISLPVVNPTFTSNGQAALDDHDLCNIYTGGFTNWNQTSIASKVTAGTITVAFRGDGSGTSFIFLNHLAAVCTGTNAPPAGVTLVATQNFASIFPTTQGGIFQTPFVISGVTYYTPSNFVPETGSGGIANYLSGLGTPAPAPTSAISYLSPDFTSVDPKSNATLSNGTKSKLVVAGVINATNGTAYTPTNTNITTGLNNALSGQNLTAPTTKAELSNPTAYVPLIQTTKSGYSLVGYTTFDLAQCYTVKAVGTSLVNFLNDHYGVAAYKTTEANNGFISLNLTKASGFVTAIKNNIFSNKKGYNLDIDDSTVCAGIGR